MASVTVEHLLMHKAGFDRLRSVEPMFVHGQRPLCPYDIGRLAHMRLDFSPGERSAYSNLGYCLLGVILERVAGEPYRVFMSREYGLDEAGIHFVDGEFFVDEVGYDFRNSDVYGEGYSRYFDFYAISSSAGLSGSAAALAQAVRSMVLRETFSLTSAIVSPRCDRTALRSCYGYAFFTLGRPGEEFHIHVQPGLLYGVSALTVVDSEGGVLVWLGNGMPVAGEMVGDDMTIYLLGVLADYYSGQPPMDKRRNAL
jgi:D-alanyl-D-alanine carboxypeptidase